MAKSVELVPLNCIRCDTPVPADPDEVAWVCAQCGQGLLLDDDRGLIELKIHYATGIPLEVVGRPFWVAGGRVVLQKREVYKDIIPKDLTPESHNFWHAKRTFFVPAFECSFGHILHLGRRLLKDTPQLSQSRERVFFEPITLLPRDVPALAELIVFEIEARRSDMLERLDFELTLDEPSLWVFPPFEVPAEKTFALAR